MAKVSLDRPDRRHAIVIGASMAGLLAARVLSEHFERVTVLERDQLPDGASPRKGVPQGRHAHVLLKSGESILLRLFPDLVDALMAGGAVTGDMGQHLKWHHFGLWKKRFRSGIDVLYFSRPHLEWLVRQRVVARDNVTIRAGVEVTGFLAEPGRVRGVTLVEEGVHTDLAADLVVDASGRGSQTPQRLEALGYPRVAESVVKVAIGYATRDVRGVELVDARALYVVSKPPLRRMACVFPIEGGAWRITLGGWLDDHAPTDDAGFLEFARGLPVPDVARALEGATPLTPIVTHKFPANLRRHYESLARFPEGLVVMGDAVCSFNPVYGQGMAVSAKEAEVLDHALHKGRLGREVQKAIARVVAVPWFLTTGEDLRHPEVGGARRAFLPIVHWYTGRVHRRAAANEQVAMRFFEVLHLVRGPASLFTPGILARVLFGSDPATDMTSSP